MPRWLREQAGQSLAEIALSLPILVFCLIGGGDIARAFAIQLAVQNAARAGAEGTALDVTPTQTEADSWAKQELGNTPGLTASNATVTLTLTDGAGGSCSASPPTYANPCYAQVRVQYTWSTLVAWPMLPHTFTFDRTVMVRKYS